MARPLNKAEAHGKYMTHLSKSLAIGLTIPIITRVVYLDSTIRNKGNEATSLISGGRLFSLFPYRGLKVFIKPSRITKSYISLWKRLLLAYVLQGPRTSPQGEEVIVIEGLAKSLLACAYRILSVRQRYEARSPSI